MVELQAESLAGVDLGVICVIMAVEAMNITGVWKERKMSSACVHTCVHWYTCVFVSQPPPQATAFQKLPPVA